MDEPDEFFWIHIWNSFFCFYFIYKFLLQKLIQDSKFHREKNLSANESRLYQTWHYILHQFILSTFCNTAIDSMQQNKTHIFLKFDF